MNHRIAAALLLAALVAGACSGGASPEPAPAPDEAQLEQELIDDLEAQLDSGPQLETLNYIRQQVDTRVAADIALITDELRWGPRRLDRRNPPRRRLVQQPPDPRHGGPLLHRLA